MRSNQGVLLPGGESSDDHHVAAANAAAAKMADELGVSSSVRQLTSPPSSSSGLSSGRNSNDNGSQSQSQKRFNFTKLLSRRSSSANMEDPKEESTSMYQVMPTEGSVPPGSAPERNKSQAPPRIGGTGRMNRTILSPIAIMPYTPPDLISPGGTRQRAVGQSKDFDDLVSVQSGVEPCFFDVNGNRAPYREGPYECHHTFDGRLVKKRWYGRMEDGYLAWSSMYLHEYFGCIIYMPLTPEEQEGMKHDKYIPNWMYEFNSLPNLAIPISYFCIGVALQLLRTPLIVYFINDQGASAAQVNVLFTVMAVPWCFKVLYGFLSDCVPISGLRRKPYFMTGWLIYILANFTLMIPEAPSIAMCISLVFVQTAGYMLADVMTDALIVERSRYETQETRGTMQSKGYIIRFFGSTVGAIIGSVVYNRDQWEWYLPIRFVFFINGVVPMVFLLPVVPYLLELDTNCRPKNFFHQCRELFQVVQLRSVWQPMAFVYVYNAMQLTNAAWMNFLVEGLDFTAWMIGIVSIVGSVMAWFGIMTYKRFFFASNWRIVYFWCTTLATAIALAQLILVFGLNRKLYIPDLLFSMGDDVLVEFVIAVQFLPMCIMYLGLCPPGSEGTTYAMLTTWSNLAGSLAFDISTALTSVWDVASQTIADGDYSGVWKLSLLCGVIGPLPLLLLGLIPKSKDDQKRLQQDQTRHWGAGVIFLVVMFATLAITFIESIYEVYFRHEEEEATEFTDTEAEVNDAVRRRLMRLAVGH